MLQRTVRLMPTTLLGLVLLGSSGCYYSQAVKGHFQLMRRQRPVEEMVQDEKTPAELRAKLTLILRLRAFAQEELGLPPGKHYLRYADLGREYVVWNVFAAPEFSLESKSWWYPFVGRLKYRGFFDEADAQQCASRLREKGWDVHVGGIEAYSTLGWFRDPVLNTFMDRDEAELADLIFHELAHQRVFVRGDTEFNEAFAVTVAREGVRRWFAVSGDVAAHERYMQQEARERAMIGLIQEARKELADAYTASSALPPDARRQRKQQIINAFLSRRREVQSQFSEAESADTWQTKPVNNARLNTVSLYYDLVPGFEQLLRNSEGNMAMFYQQVLALGRESKEMRRLGLTHPGLPVR